MASKLTEKQKAKLLNDTSQKINELEQLEIIEEMLRDNIYEFKYIDDWYRVKKPGRGARQELREAKNKKKNELLRDSSNVTEEELLKLYLNRDIPVDISAMRKKIVAYQHKIEDLAKAVIEQPVDSEKEKLMQNIEDYQYQQRSIQLEINELLNSCIEKQLKDFVQEYLVFVALEKKHEDGTWKRCFSSYAEFMDADDRLDQLIYRATYYFTVLILKNEII